MVSRVILRRRTVESAPGLHKAKSYLEPVLQSFPLVVQWRISFPEIVRLPAVVWAFLKLLSREDLAMRLLLGRETRCQDPLSSRVAAAVPVPHLSSEYANGYVHPHSKEP